VFAKVLEPAPKVDVPEPELVEPTDIATDQVNAVVAPDAIAQEVNAPMEALVNRDQERVAPSIPVSAVNNEEPKSKTSLWVVAGLFVAALAVAAYMQPREEPASEPAPPLLVLPSEDAASVASGADVPASEPVEAASAVAAPQKTASVAVTPSSAPSAAASKAP
jgi:hypothetical protein